VSIGRVTDGLVAHQVNARPGMRSSWRARCPVHDDQHPSVDIDETADGTVLVMCRVCGKDATPAILAAAGLTLRDLFPAVDQGAGQESPKRRVVATYDYRSEDGTLLYQSCRFEPGKDGRKKDFQQRRPARPGEPNGWVWNIAGVERVLYRLPELLEANPDGWVYIPEGEAKVEALRGLGLTATCNVGGGGKGKWLPGYTAALKGRNVVLLPDNDQAGREHAETVAKALEGVAASVLVIELSGLPPKGDVLDWLAAGHTGTELQELLRKKLEGDRPKAVCLTYSDVEALPVPWLWEHWLAEGAITICDGDPGIGKSMLTCDLAARVSRGWCLPPNGGTVVRTPAGVLMLNAEDSPSYTIRPRLDVMGADVSKVHSLTGVLEKGEVRPAALPWDLQLVAELVRRHGVKFVVVDPFMAYLSSEIKSKDDHDVRRCLSRLKTFAEELNLCVLMLRHLNKQQGGPALYRGGSSIGIIGAARCAWLVGKDPDCKGRFVLSMNKSNIGPTPKSLSYQIDTSDGFPRIGWTGLSDKTADDLVSKFNGNGHGDGRGRQPVAVDNAMEWLRDRLANGPVPATDLYEQGKAAGHAERTIDRAKERLELVSRKRGDGWVWELMEGPRVHQEDEGLPDW
jgi:putative DNA primase/helicase